MTIGPLANRIWAHTGAQLTEGTSELAAVPGGLVLSGDVQGPLADQMHAGPTAVMLQHRPEPPDPAPTLFGDAETAADQAWLQRQLQRKVQVLTSRTTWLPNPASPADFQGLVDEAMRRCRDFLALAACEVPDHPRMAVFAIDYRWLRTAAPRSLLVRAVSDLDGPVGVMVGHRDDPFTDVRAIEGLVALIRAHPQMALLRSDHAALGALALGAVAGSIGLSTGSRHFVPPGQRGFKHFEDKTARLLVPSIWAFWRGSRFDVMPDLPLYRCDCRVCGGRSVARFQDERLALEADRHTVTCWSDIAAELRDLTSSQREKYWFELCRRAVTNLDELFLQDGILAMPSLQLQAWCKFAGIPVA